MEIFRYIFCFVLFLLGTQARAADQHSVITAFNADSIEILNSVFSAQYILLLISLVIGAVFGVLWRRKCRFEDIGWIIVVITLSMGFACVLLRVKLGT